MDTIQMTGEWIELSRLAWLARENAKVFGNTKVGACIVSDTSKYYSGCNVEHIFRSHDIHAEVNAISNMITGGDRLIVKILIVAERDFFTPCGSCMDWIMQHSKPDSLIGFQGSKGTDISVFKPSELMPFYPH